MRRMVYFAGCDIALMTLEFEAGVRLAGEEPALLVFPIRGFREFIEDIGFGAELRQFFDRGIGRGGLSGLRFVLSRSCYCCKSGKQQTEVSTRIFCHELSPSTGFSRCANNIHPKIPGIQGAVLLHCRRQAQPDGARPKSAGW
jgi:hypothetical protein